MGKRLSVTVGCDPEIFVAPKNKKTLVTAHGLIPGNKYDPHNVLDGMVQVDGCALEFGIIPANNAYEWFDRVKSVMAQLKDMVPSHKLLIQPTAEFETSYWERSVPDAAKELGCEPDFNAWTGEMNPKPDTTKSPTLRTAAGHIHVGWCKNKDVLDKNHIEDCRLVVKQLDYYIGIFSLIWDPDGTRRELYGKAGAYRPKPYGCEYRVPSNMWLSCDGLIDWVYYAVRVAVQDLAMGKSQEALHGDRAQKIIDDNQTNWMREGLMQYTFNPAYNVKQYLSKAEGSRGPIWQ